MLRRVEFIGSGYECVRFVMVDTTTMAEAYEAAKKWYAETKQDFHYIGMEIPKEYAYNESLAKGEASPTALLSVKAGELLKFLQQDYKVNGYMYSGSWPYVSLKERGFEKEVILELCDAGKIQRRDCDDYAFELSVQERGDLLAYYDLCSVWYKKVGDSMLPEIQQEVRNASGILTDKDSGKVTVSTVKHVGDTGKPERKQVYCPFSVGQVINMEYDLPKRNQHTGYSRMTSVPGGKAVGQFMVTDIVHNMLVSPGMNMLEVQSLCEEFNKAYPQNRTMMVFEDVLLTRMKENEVSLGQFVLTHEGSSTAGKIVGASHELSVEDKARIYGRTRINSVTISPYSPLSVDELVSEASVRSKQSALVDEVKVLSFVDDIGYTQFSVDAGWYEKQKNKNDVSRLFEKASFDEDSGFKDLTGKYLEPEI